MVDKPLIVQSDLSLLLDVHSSSSEATRNDLLPFAELVKSPEHVHTYAVTNISLWNAASLGIDSGEVLRRLEKWSRYPLNENVIFHINEIGGRFGSIKLLPYDEENYLLEVEQERFRREIMGNKSLAKSIGLADNGFIVPHYRRGEVKVELIKMNLPVDDQVPLNRGESLPITFREVSKGGILFILRDYQRLAAYSVLGDGGPGSGYGTIVLPCGSGKTIVGWRL